MAWYAELKRRRWYCIKSVDMIHFYKKYLYDEWYNSLTEEQKLRLEEYRKKEKERKERETLEALYRLQYMTSVLKSKCSGYYSKDIFDEIW
jgi:hypothetical protein